MKASFIAALLAQALAVNALQKYCNGGQGLDAALTYFPTFRGACFSSQNARDREDASQSCTGGCD
ncbi:hypothetical protein COL922a_007170 [Colletotrichum nupharicola]|nr:hypothetical protein COL922a_007170 [Colletotrichum nupharicola]